MHRFVQDLRYAVRLLARTPWATATAVIALGLGIGANTAIFSVIHKVLLQPLPFTEPDRLVQLERAFPEGLGPAHSVPRFVYWREHNTVFEKMAAYDDLGAGFNVTGDGLPERIRGSRVSAEFFSVFGVQPALGRDFIADDDLPGAPLVVVLSHRLWQNRFGGDPSILDRPITLNGEGYTVIGVTPPFFRYPAEAELWTPVQIDPNDTNQGNYLMITARLKGGVEVEEALAEMKVVQRHFMDSVGASPDDPESASVRPLHEFLYGHLRPAFLVLLGAMILVLLIACANVANLELARAAKREKEMALRAALGAGMGRIVRQVLTEGAVLSLLGGVAGLLLCVVTLQPLLALAPTGVARFQQVHVDGTVLAFSIAIALVSGLIFALAPALQARRIQLSETLKEGSTGSGAGGGVRGRRLRLVLVVSEVALTFVLMVGAHLLIRSFDGLRSVEPGFASDNVLTLKLALPELKYGDPKTLDAFLRQVLPQMESLPGVSAAAAVSSLPLEMGPDLPFSIEGRYDPATDAGRGDAQYRMTTPGYFEMMGIPLLQGRALAESDSPEAPGVVLINQTAARRYWAGEDPIGERITIGVPGLPEFADPAPRTIIGVVGDVRELGLGNDPPVTVYIPVGQIPPAFAMALIRFLPYSLVVKTEVAPESVIQAVKETVWRYDPEQPVTGVVTMGSIVDRSIGSERFNMVLLGLLAGIALLLAVVGIYGVLAYLVSQRIREVGIRVAMGARGIDVARLVLKQGLSAVLIGMAIGLVGAFASTRLLSSMVYGVSTTDPFSFVAVTLLLALVATLAILIPAGRASRIDPIVALRHE